MPLAVNHQMLDVLLPHSARAPRLTPVSGRSGVTIRAATSRDRSAMRRICAATAADRPFLPYADVPEMAAIEHLDPYLSIEPESCFLAELDGVVVGYIVGAVDSDRFAARLRRYRQRQVPAVLLDAVLLVVGGRARRWATVRALLSRQWRAIRGDHTNPCPLPAGRFGGDFPAHVHLQLLPSARGHRIGLALTLAFEAYAKRAGAAGQHSRVVERRGDQRYSEMLMALGAEVVEETTFTRREQPSLIDDGVWVERVLVRRYRG